MFVEQKGINNKNMETAPQIVELPAKFSDVVRSMKVGESLDITNKTRSSTYSQAKIAFPEADFKTRQHDGKVYLTRTA